MKSWFEQTSRFIQPRFRERSRGVQGSLDIVAATSHNHRIKRYLTMTAMKKLLLAFTVLSFDFVWLGTYAHDFAGAALLISMLAGGLGQGRLDRGVRARQRVAGGAGLDGADPCRA